MAKVTAEEVLKSLPQSNDPMEFLRQAANPSSLASIKKPDALPQKTEEEVKTLVAPPREEIKEETPLPAEEAPSDDFVPQVEEPIKNTSAKTSDKDSDVQNKQADASGIEDVDDDGDPTKAGASEGQHFKKLRTSLKETKKTLEEITKSKQQLEAELTKYKTGEVVPEVLLEKENRIAHLEHFEKLHSLKTSREYQENFVKPLETVTNKLKEFAADYEVPVEVLNKALNIENRAELNGFLSSHFDEVGALEVKQLITEARDIHSRASEAEKEPARALQNLHEEHKRVFEQQEVQRKSRIASVSRDGWVESLSEIRKEGKASELIMRDNDPEYNDKFVKPYLTTAAVEYGKLIKSFAENGITDLPKEVSKALAKAVLYGHAAAIAIHSREVALAQAEEIKTNTARTNGYVRPGIGGNYGGNVQTPAPNKPATTEDAATGLLRKVGVAI